MAEQIHQTPAEIESIIRNLATHISKEYDSIAQIDIRRDRPAMLEKAALRGSIVMLRTEMQIQFIRLKVAQRLQRR